MTPLSPGYRALRAGRRSLDGQLYLVTTVTWQRRPYFADAAMARTASRKFSETTFWLPGHCHCWVLMPDHWHGLMELSEGANLSDAVGRFKGGSARHLNAPVARSGPVWAKGFHDHALRRDESIADIARYILANPLRAGLVTDLREYPYLDQRWREALDDLE